MPKPGPKPGQSPYNAQDADYTTTYQQEYVHCGKANCSRCKDAGLGHGPYWYAYRYSPTRKRRLKWYLGKNGPPTAGD
jgi:hypothetical protein